MQRRRYVLALTAVAAVGVLVGPTAAFAGSPSGEVAVGKTVIEPAYDAANGHLVYLSTPAGTAGHGHPNGHNVAPLYLPLYPTSAASSVGTMNCQHQPMDNCPDHGPLVAGLAKSVMPSVYGAGVWGHDHIVGIASTGGDFNILWEPIAILFTSSAAANQHLTTLAEINTALSLHQIIEIPLPSATFSCSAVSAAVFNHGTPLTPVPPLP